MYCPACEVCSEENERVTVECVAFLRVSVRVMLSPEVTGPEAVLQSAEGMLVKPEMTSLTVQVRVRLPLPASTGPSSDTSAASTSRETAWTKGNGMISMHL